LKTLFRIAGYTLTGTNLVKYVGVLASELFCRPVRTHHTHGVYRRTRVMFMARWSILRFCTLSTTRTLTETAGFGLQSEVLNRCESPSRKPFGSLRAPE